MLTELDCQKGVHAAWPAHFVKGPKQGLLLSAQNTCLRTIAEQFLYGDYPTMKVRFIESHFRL